MFVERQIVSALTPCPLDALDWYQLEGLHKSAMDAITAIVEFMPLPCPESILLNIDFSDIDTQTINAIMGNGWADG